MDRLQTAGRALLKRSRRKINFASISKFLLSRVIILIPLSATFVGFILVTISLFAGINKGSLEDLDIFRVSTANLGHNLVNTVFDAVSLNATALGDEILGAGTGQSSANATDNAPSLGNLLGARAAGSKDETSQTENTKLPRGLLDGLLGDPNANAAPSNAAQAPSVNGLPGLPNLPSPPQPGQTQKGQSQSPASTLNDINPLAGLINAPNPVSSAAKASGTMAPGGATNAVQGLINGATAGLGGALNQGKSQIYGAVQTVFDSAKEAIKNNLAGVGDSAADQITQRLNVSEWYSLHVIDLCQGNFEPSGTTSSPGLNTTFCNTKPANRLDSVKSLAEPFVIGPLTIDLSKTNLPETINQLVDLINGLLLGLFLLYLFRFWIGLLIFVRVTAFLKRRRQRQNEKLDYPEDIE
ncbi:hypothetical protein HRG_007036 [Hirsutella rhossiliensis]|uniref:Uncharacterized protein n=1 Tax=Hirsutella rhossiliensis TaxID=111463 RepID=A0A9P8SIE9_9HYPO|nr:uncharacterized protein HRG_07036 [Hirsutella rhossiliensis]KAH0961956.1 hypothetical protein HRG_07036 [Hirsutella rhossiliensis]